MAAGFTIEKRRIHLHTPVKTLGQHTVKIKLHADVSVDVNFRCRVRESDRSAR